MIIRDCHGLESDLRIGDGRKEYITGGSRDDWLHVIGLISLNVSLSILIERYIKSKTRGMPQWYVQSSILQLVHQNTYNLGLDLNAVLFLWECREFQLKSYLFYNTTPSQWLLPQHIYVFQSQCASAFLIICHQHQRLALFIICWHPEMGRS